MTPHEIAVMLKVEETYEHSQKGNNKKTLNKVQKLWLESLFSIRKPPTEWLFLQVYRIGSVVPQSSPVTSDGVFNVAETPGSTRDLPKPVGPTWFIRFRKVAS